MCGQQLARTLAETDAVAVALTPASQRDGISVLHRAALLARIEAQRLFSTPRKFEQRATAAISWPRNGAGGEQVARAQVAAADSMVRQLLRH